MNQKSRDCLNPWTQESKPMNQKREEEGIGFREREKKLEIDKERSKRTIQTQTSTSRRLHAVPMLLISFASSSSFFSGRSPFLILLGRSSSLFFFSAAVWDFFNQPNLRASCLRSREIETKRDKCHTNTETNLGFLASLVDVVWDIY